MATLFETGIRPAVDLYLKRKSEEVRSYGAYWSASSAGYCMRLVIMRRLGVPRVPELEDSAALTRIFESGHIFHRWMQEITKEAGLSVASEVELQDEELMIRGHFDDLVYIEPNADYKDNRLILYDYKTAHSASFSYNKGRPIGFYHSMQLGTYMYMIRTLQKAEIKPAWLDSLPALVDARILSISKDDLRMDEKPLLWSPELEKKVYAYWSTLNGYWKAYQKNGTLPRCTCLDNDGGFFGRRSAKGKIYNDFFWKDEPCSEEWFNKWKDEHVSNLS